MTPINELQIRQLFLKALQAREPLMDQAHRSAFRVFNGFYEGIEGLVADLYGSTLVLFDYAESEPDSLLNTQTARDVLLEVLPWIRCVIIKRHRADDASNRQGEICFGSQPAQVIEEAGVQYAVDLLLNQDASFYLDTRNLRAWIMQNCGGRKVLNTFAYTGSLGIAALAGGASRVLQMDRSRKFLEQSHRSLKLNNFDPGRMKLQAVDFFVGVGQLKRQGMLFDMVILDPPFFSISEKGLVDQTNNSTRLINKVRPLVKDGGRIVAINNSLFLEGSAYLKSLEELTQDGFVEIEELLPIPEDITGYSHTIHNLPVVDPSPFNHPTKIAILRIKRKNQDKQ